MKQGYTEIIAIIDKSGSMEAVKKDSIGGFNSFIKSQKEEEGEANLTLVLFDTVVKTVYESKPISKVTRLTSKSYVPGGMTAMNDAIGSAVNSLGVRLAAMDESDRPENVIVAILTDGDENSSKEFSPEAIREMITEQSQKYSWEFIFLAANQDAIEAGGNIGINVDRCMSYAGDSAGTTEAYASIAMATSSIRSGNRDFSLNSGS